VIIAGIGCRRDVSAADVGAVLNHALTVAGLRADDLVRVAIPSVKATEPGIVDAVAARGVPLILIAQADLEAAAPRTLSRSDHSLAAMGVPSVAEAAALAAAGSAARLLMPRVALGGATCALATIAACPA